MKSIIRIESIRDFKGRDKIETAVRYNISYIDRSAEEYQTIFRSHWAIENKINWSIDVAFNEDLNRKKLFMLRKTSH